MFGRQCPSSSHSRLYMELTDESAKKSEKLGNEVKKERETTVHEQCSRMICTVYTVNFALYSQILQPYHGKNAVESS